MSNYPHQTPLRQTYPDRPTWTAPIGTPKPTTSPRKTPKSVKSIGRLKFSNYAIGEPRRVESRGLGQPSRLLDFGSRDGGFGLRDYSQSRDYTQIGSRDYSQTRDFTQTRFQPRQTLTVREEPEREESNQVQAAPRDLSRDQPLQTRESAVMSRDYSIPSLQHALNPGQDSLFAGVAREMSSEPRVESREQIQSRDRQPSIRRNLRSVVVEPVPAVVVTETEDEDTAPPVRSLRDVSREPEQEQTRDHARDTTRERSTSAKRPSRLASGLESWQAEVSMTQAEGVSFTEPRESLRAREARANESRDIPESRETESRDTIRPESRESEFHPQTVSVPLNDEEPGEEASRARRGTPLPSRDPSRGSRSEQSRDISISRGSPGGAPDSALEESFEIERDDEEVEPESREVESREKSFSNINYFTKSREKNKSFEAEEEPEEPESSEEEEVVEEVDEVESRDVDEVESRDVEEIDEARDSEPRDTQSIASHDSHHESVHSTDSTDSSRFRSRYLQDKLSRGQDESREQNESRSRNLLSEHRMADTSLDRIKQSAIKKHSKREGDKSRDDGESRNESRARDLMSEHRMADTTWDRIKQSAIKKHSKQDGDKSRDQTEVEKSRDFETHKSRDLLSEHRMADTSLDRIKASAIKKHSRREGDKSRDGIQSRDTIQPSRDAEKAQQQARDQEEHERKTAEARDRVEREIREKNARDQEKLARIEAARAERLAKRRRTEEGHVSVSHDQSGHVNRSMDPPHVTSKLRHVTLEHPQQHQSTQEEEDDDMSIISELTEVDVQLVGARDVSRDKSRVSNSKPSRDFTSRYGIPEFDETEATARSGLTRDQSTQSGSRDLFESREQPESRAQVEARDRNTSGETTISQHSTNQPNHSIPASPDSTSRATDLGSPRDHGAESRDLGGINTHVTDNLSRDKNTTTHNRQNSILSPFDRRSAAATNGKRRFSESREPAHFETRDVATVHEWRSLDFLITSSLQQQVWANRFRQPGNAVLRIPPSIRTCFPLISESRLRDMIVSVVYCRQSRLKDRQIAGHRERRKVPWWKRWF
ncbi:DNA topoisomerase 1 [Yarrowia sp. B02]|nr:DNA topoisomerase 1 [Yarrowia sp. B02]